MEVNKSINQYLSCYVNILISLKMSSTLRLNKFMYLDEWNLCKLLACAVKFTSVNTVKSSDFLKLGLSLFSCLFLFFRHPNERKGSKLGQF